MQDITTTDFSKFGNRERIEAEELLKAWREEGLPDDFKKYEGFCSKECFDKNQ